MEFYISLVFSQYYMVCIKISRGRFTSGWNHPA